MKTALSRLFFALIAILLSATALANPPAQSGPNVIRFEDGAAWGFVDFENGTQVILGANMAEFCGGLINFDIVSFTEVSVPQDTDRIKQLIKGEVQATVWGFTDFDCALFTTELPLAAGMVRIQGNDNDLVVFLRDNNNANSFGIRANGDMWSPASGERYRFHLVWHIVWDGVDGEKFFKEILKFGLK